MKPKTISLNDVLSSIQVGYKNWSSLDIAKDSKQEIMNLFNVPSDIVEEFYDSILRDEWFKNFVENELQRTLSNSNLTKLYDLMNLDEDNLIVSMSLYLNTYYKDGRKVFGFNWEDDIDSDDAWESDDKDPVDWWLFFRWFSMN